MSYCTECGIKIQEEYKFCPNCGAQIVIPKVSVSKTVPSENNIIICKNCGEENSKENSNCISCGIALREVRNKKPIQTKQVPDSIKKTKSKNEEAPEKKSVPPEKVVNNKKIFIISTSIIVVLVAALIFSGVFDSGIVKDNTDTNNQTTNSGPDLNKLNEINDLEEKVNANPDDMESLLHLAHLQQDSKFYEKAITNYEKYLVKNPGNSDARVDLGICYYNLTDYTSAIKEMENALTYQPKHQIAHLNLGIVNLTAGNLQTAKDWFKKAFELDPDSEAGKRAQDLLNSH